MQSCGSQWRKFGDLTKTGVHYSSPKPQFLFNSFIPMARPRKNNAEYFSHDANMRSDRKIIALRAKYWLEGYAIRCMLQETLAWAENFIISYNDMEIELLAWDFGVDSDIFADIVLYMVKIKLLELENQVLSCSALVESLEPLLNKRKRYREQSWSSNSDDVEVLDNQNEVMETETIVPETKMPHSIVKHSKGKKRKHSRVLKSTSEKFLNLSKEQKKDLISTYWDSLFRRYEKKLLNYITSKWDPYDSHYHTLLVRFDKDNIKPQTVKVDSYCVEITPMTKEQRKQARNWLLTAREKLLKTTTFTSLKHPHGN